MEENLKLKLDLLLPFVLKGDKIDMIIPIGIAEEILKKAGFIFDISDIDINGWQGDYWFDVIKDDITYSISGSMYYGKFRMQREE